VTLHKKLQGHCTRVSVGLLRPFGSMRPKPKDKGIAESSNSADIHAQVTATDRRVTQCYKRKRLISSRTPVERPLNRSQVVNVTRRINVIIDIWARPGGAPCARLLRASQCVAQASYNRQKPILYSRRPVHAVTPPDLSTESLTTMTFTYLFGNCRAVELTVTSECDILTVIVDAARRRATGYDDESPTHAVLTVSNWYAPRSGGVRPHLCALTHRYTRPRIL